MSSRDCIGKDACSLVGNTPMIYLNRVVDGCKAKVGEYFCIIFLRSNFLFSGKAGISKSSFVGEG